jgi:hypothetical protein
MAKKSSTNFARSYLNMSPIEDAELDRANERPGPAGRSVRLVPANFKLGGLRGLIPNYEKSLT